MKKLLIAAVCFTVIVSMSSCTDDSSMETKNESAATLNKIDVTKTSDVKADGDGTKPPKP